MQNFIKKSFIAGLLVTIPLGLTYFLFSFFITKLDRLMAPVVREVILKTGAPLPEDFHLPGLGFFLICIFMLLVGMLAANFLGNKLVETSDRILTAIPLVRSIYTTIKEVIKSISNVDSAIFEKPVVIRYPHLSSYVMGIVSCNSKGEVVGRTRDNLVNVFVPMLPNVTLGWMMVIPEEQITYLKMGREEAIKFLLSFGIVDGETETEGGARVHGTDME